MTTRRLHTAALSTWLAMIDLFCLIAGSVIGVMMRFGPEDMSQYVFGHLEGWLLLFLGVLLANYLVGSYRVQYTFSRFNLVVGWLFSLTFALLLLSITSYAWLFKDVLGRGVLFLSIAWYSVISLCLKLLVYRALFRSPMFLCRTVILGSGERAQKLRETIENRFVLPIHKVVACIRIADVERDGSGNATLVHGVAVVNCAPEDLEEVVRSLDVNLIVIGLEDLEKSKRFHLQLRRLRFKGVEVLTPLNVAEIYKGLTPLELINDEYLMEAGMESRLPVLRRIKRLLDIATASVACVVLLPLGLLIAALIKLSAPRSPVFYTQPRVGRFGLAFNIYKFRTMRDHAERETGPVWADDNDQRITRLGRILRKSRLDEIPQFINVLQGHMSIVGPRPERPEFVEKLEKEIPYYNERQNLMPGLTGWAQIRYQYGHNINDAARKLEYDLYYIKNLSLSLDLQIILSTLRIVLFGKERSI